MTLLRWIILRSLCPPTRHFYSLHLFLARQTNVSGEKKWLQEKACASENNSFRFSDERSWLCHNKCFLSLCWALWLFPSLFLQTPSVCWPFSPLSIIQSLCRGRSWARLSPGLWTEGHALEVVLIKSPSCPLANTHLHTQHSLALWAQRWPHLSNLHKQTHHPYTVRRSQLDTITRYAAHTCAISSQDCHQTCKLQTCEKGDAWGNVSPKNVLE